MNSIAELRGVKDEIAAICQRHGVQKLSLFGSALQQTLRQDSDFDFLVEFKPDAKIGLIEFGRLQLELETLLNSMQDAVIAVDADTRVQWANRGMNRLLPYAPRLNAPLVDSVRDPDFLSAIQGAVRDQTVNSTRSNTIVPGRTFDVTAAPMPGGGAVAVLRDLTETERMEKTRRDFIANVSHELRTPLTSIQGYAETLLDSSSENNHVREFLEIIRKNAARMSRLTEDLLTLARVESGEQRFDIQEVSADELLQDALESFREVARSYGIELVEEKK